MARRERPGHRRAAGGGAGARPADRGHARLRARPAHQRRRAHQRGRSRPAPAAVRRPGGGARRWPPTLDAVNRQRQAVEASMLDAAMQAAERADRRRPRRACWWPARTGIPAWSASSPGGSRSGSTARPASPRWPTASPRAAAGRWPGIDLGAAVIAARQAGMLLTGGGHAMAAGFSLAEAAAGRRSTPSWTSAWPRPATLPSAADLAVEGTVAVPRLHDRAGAAAGAGWRRSATATRSRC